MSLLLVQFTQSNWRQQVRWTLKRIQTLRELSHTSLQWSARQCILQYEWQVWSCVKACYMNFGLIRPLHLLKRQKIFSGLFVYSLYVQTQIAQKLQSEISELRPSHHKTIAYVYYSFQWCVHMWRTHWTVPLFQSGQELMSWTMELLVAQQMQCHPDRNTGSATTAVTTPGQGYARTLQSVTPRVKVAHKMIDLVSWEI